MLDITVPKQTVIQNERLGMLLWAGRFLVVIYLYMVLVQNKQSALKVQEAGDGAGGFWVESREYANMAALDIATAPFCDRTLGNQYSFLYDSARAYEYTDFICRAPPGGERFYKFLPNALYLTTFFEETFVEAIAVETTCRGGSCLDGDCVELCSAQDPPMSYSHMNYDENGVTLSCVCSRSQSQDVWVAGVEEQFVAFDHVLDIRDPGNPAAPPRRYSGTDPDLPDSDKVLTCIRTGDGEIIDLSKKGFLTGGSACLPICNKKNKEELKACSYGFKFGEILDFGGYPDLNVVGPKDAGYNMFQDAEFSDEGAAGSVKGQKVGPAPILRMIGGEIKVSIEYYNPADPGFMPGEHIGDHKGPVCYITFKASPKWNSMPLTQHEMPPQPDGSTRYRYMYNYGYTLVFERSGSFTQYATPMVMATLALPVVLIWMALPEKLVGFIAKAGLGKMSVLYKRAMFQPFNAGSLLTSQLARAMVATLAFNSVSVKNEEGLHVLKRKRVETLLRDVFEGDKTVNTEKEIAAFAEVFLEKASSDRVKDDEKPESINKVEFLTLLTLADTGSIQEVTACADADADRNPLEKVFCDTSIGKIRNVAQNLASDRTFADGAKEMERREPTMIETSMEGMTTQLLERVSELEKRLQKAGLMDDAPAAPANGKPVAPVGKEEWPAEEAQVEVPPE